MIEQSSSGMATLAVHGRIAGCDVTITADVDPADLKPLLSSILQQLTEMGVEPLPKGQDEALNKAGTAEAQHHSLDLDDSPLSRLGREIDLSASEVSKVLGFKGTSIQVYKASQYQVTDAVCILCLGFEKGLGLPGIDYETFSAALVSNQIKMKAPISTLCFNLAADGLIDKKSYDDGRLVTLTPSGENRAMKAIKDIVAGKAPVKKKPA